MKWVEYNKDFPPTVGKYVVKTLTRMGNVYKIESTFSGKNWSCTNQIVTHYLDETDKDLHEILEHAADLLLFHYGSVHSDTSNEEYELVRKIVDYETHS